VLRFQNTKSFLKKFFGEETTLVPIPKSSLTNNHSLWVPEKIAKALEKQGLGYYYPCLQRHNAVPKSAYSKSEDRPKAIDHYNTIKFIPQIKQPKKIILIEDVITRGATMIGCASIIKQKFPSINIKGFAALRTISKPEDFKDINEPCIGKITLKNNTTIRIP
jgi:predicted amidophosphoribosyltransferase